MTQRRSIWCELDADIWRTFAYQATKRGMKLPDFAAFIIKDWLERFAETDPDDPNSRLFAAFQRAKDKELYLTQLEHIAATATALGSEEDLDDLSDLCNEFDIPVDEVLERVKQLRRPRSLPKFDDGTGVRSAITWLQNLRGELRKTGDTLRLPSSEIRMLGAERGFSYATLKAAKPHLDIESVREDKQWWWVWPEE